MSFGNLKQEININLECKVNKFLLFMSTLFIVF